MKKIIYGVIALFMGYQTIFSAEKLSAMQEFNINKEVLLFAYEIAYCQFTDKKEDLFKKNTEEIRENIKQSNIKKSLLNNGVILSAKKLSAIQEFNINKEVLLFAYEIAYCQFTDKKEDLFKKNTEEIRENIKQSNIKQSNIKKLLLNNGYILSEEYDNGDLTFINMRSNKYASFITYKRDGYFILDQKSLKNHVECFEQLNKFCKQNNRASFTVPVRLKTKEDQEKITFFDEHGNQKEAIIRPKKK